MINDKHINDWDEIMILVPVFFFTSANKLTFVTVTP